MSEFDEAAEPLLDHPAEADDILIEETMVPQL